MKTSRLTLFAALALIAIAGLAAGCGGNDDDIPVDAVAVVDGTVINKANLEDLLNRAKSSYKSNNRAFPKAGTADYQSLQQQAVAYLVQREEYEKEAAKRNIVITPAQMEKRIAQVAKEFFGGDTAEMKKQLAAQDYTDATFREDIRSQLVQEALFAKAVKANPVTAADVQKYYNDNKSQYSVPESRQVRHILVKTKAEADDVIARLKAGEDFAKLAKELSLDPGSKDSGGEYTARRGETVPEFDKAAFSLKTHELSAADQDAVRLPRDRAALGHHEGVLDPARLCRQDDQGRPGQAAPAGRDRRLVERGARHLRQEDHVRHGLRAARDRNRHHPGLTRHGRDRWLRRRSRRGARRAAGADAATPARLSLGSRADGANDRAPHDRGGLRGRRGRSRRRSREAARRAR